MLSPNTTIKQNCRVKLLLKVVERNLDADFNFKFPKLPNVTFKITVGSYRRKSEFQLKCLREGDKC